MAKTILEDAMEDAKLLKETAIENAKNVLVEAISPKIKEFVEEQLGETAPGLGMPMPGMMQPQVEAGMYEKHEDEDDDNALLKQLGLAPEGDKGEDEETEDNEKEGEEEENMDEQSLAGLSGVTEGEKCDDEQEEVNEASEVVEITNEDLQAALSEVLSGMRLKEATVTKGFGAVQDATPKSAGGKGEKGIADEKSGEHQWSDEEPPHAQDWTVKESVYRQKIESLEKANGLLKSENKEYKEACAFLKRNLQEVNLFNSKLLYTNKLLHSAELNNKQRIGVIEAFDRAQSLREVELVFKSLSESLKIAGVLGESKQAQKPSLKGPKGSRYTTPSSTVLQESAKQENSTDNFSARLQELAGLVD
jgi:hypothetical protein